MIMLAWRAPYAHSDCAHERLCGRSQAEASAGTGWAQKARLQMLSLLASRQAHTRQDVAQLLGVHRHTIGRWLALYAPGGLAALLATYVPAGKPVSLMPAALASLEQARRRPEGFASYEALRHWGRRTHGVEVKDKTLYTLVRTRFQAKLQVARPSHTTKP
jgi:transposase